MERHKSVSGWLTFVLWFFYGVVTSNAMLTTIWMMFNQGWTPLLCFASMLKMLTWWTVAILTIVAFYKRKTNAVSLAMTYIAMLAFESVIGLSMINTFNYAAICQQAIFQLVCCIILFIYFKQSKRVEMIVPQSVRTWNNFEKILAVIYALSVVVIDIIL